ncbi:hypothetical protein ACLK19_21310 [Escherichia coli]
MLKKSDNMIADTVFRMIGHARFNVPEHGGPVGRRASDPAPASRCRYWKHHYCRWFRAFAA